MQIRQLLQLPKDEQKRANNWITNLKLRSNVQREQVLRDPRSSRRSNRASKPWGTVQAADIAPMQIVKFSARNDNVWVWYTLITETFSGKLSCRQRCGTIFPHMLISGDISRKAGRWRMLFAKVCDTSRSWSNRSGSRTFRNTKDCTSGIERASSAIRLRQAQRRGKVIAGLAPNLLCCFPQTWRASQVRDIRTKHEWFARHQGRSSRIRSSPWFPLVFFVFSRGALPRDA